jgi:RNA-directed DNA polymerase
VRGLTARDRGRSLEAVVGELNSLLRGWGGYFAPGLCETLAGTLDHWIRRRLRAYLWTLWKLPRTKVRNLEERGTVRRWAVTVGNTRIRRRQGYGGTRGRLAAQQEQSGMRGAA